MNRNERAQLARTTVDRWQEYIGQNALALNTDAIGPWTRLQALVWESLDEVHNSIINKIKD